MVGSWCSTMYRRRRLHATRSWSRSRVPPSIIWILSRPPERQDRYSPSTCRGYLVMSFQGSSNRLAVALRHGRQVMPCSVPTKRAARMRSIWRSSRLSSQGNHPSSPLRRRHQCRWPPKLRWQGIFTHGHLEKGQTILIHGGAGAVGAYAVQLAVHAGATVIATASGDDEAYLNSIGASRVIDYREAQFEKVLREKVDVVFDLVGGDTQKRSFLVLKEGGHLVSATQPVSQEEAARYRVSGVMMRLAPSGDVLGRIARLLEEGTIRPDVANIYAFQDAAKAWKDIAGNLPGVHGISPSGQEAARRRSHGKIVLRVA